MYRSFLGFLTIVIVVIGTLFAFPQSVQAIPCALREDVVAVSVGLDRNPFSETYVIRDVNNQDDCRKLCRESVYRIPKDEVALCEYGLNGSYFSTGRAINLGTFRRPTEVEEQVKKYETQNFWTCFITYQSDLTPTDVFPLQNPANEVTSRCVDLRSGNSADVDAFGVQRDNLGIRSEEEAQNVCYTICANQALRPRPLTCDFIRSRACKNDTELQSVNGEGFALVSSDATLSELTQEARTLRQTPAQAQSIPSLIGLIITTALTVFGSIAFAIMVYGGLLWMTARGNGDQTGKAARVIMWAVLGIIVSLASYILTDFILRGFLPGR